jgi:hypothetical protein
MTTYAIHATVTTHRGDYAGARSVPTFYVDSCVQGITDAGHAARIAADVINPLGTIPDSDLNVAAYPVDLADGPAHVPPGTYECEAQNLTESARIVSVCGDTFNPPRSIAHLDMSQRGEGWVWVTVARRPHDRSRRRERRMFRVAINESVTVADASEAR